MDVITTVTSPASSFDLTNIAAVKAECGITGSAENKRIARWIREASAEIAGWCNRVFAQETVSEQFRLSRSASELVLSRIPVASITSVVENGTTLAATDYEADKASGLLKRLSSDTLTVWPTGKITVVYRGGYELLGTLPYDVERACVLLVKSYRDNAAMNSLVRAEEIPGVLRTDYRQGGSLPTAVTDLLKNYWLPVIG